MIFKNILSKLLDLFFPRRCTVCDKIITGHEGICPKCKTTVRTLCGAVCMKCGKKLNDENIFPRRYFYPSLNKLPYVSYKEMSVSESIAKRIMCIPLYHSITKLELEKIVKCINKSLK